MPSETRFRSDGIDLDLFDQFQTFFSRHGLRLRFYRGIRAVLLQFKPHTFSSLPCKKAEDVSDRYPYIVCLSAETGGKADPIVVDLKVLGGGCADVEHDFIVADILHGNARMLVYPDKDVGGKGVVATPFAKCAEDIRFGGSGHNVPHDVPEYRNA